ncbi:NAD(P)/FAD-dependent oxidoreductase [Pseudomonas syringae]|uniref:NAD(P)/FAD-dependent oxidoreductase n=1 Tax=Pseudomonas syringae TaxID=317 RepID=UPI0006B8E981|nr:FAD-dependent oxidoreductase [Pseudomonas syringae]KPB13072.1 Nopaline dehydrogenase [Pseudomonas syringae pv. syringae]MCF5032123.1 FAD-dependent oxidoreductase [Pseudomonas syringae]POD19817.1 nopaline dehydrogenase [Pseudomonas syringae pv. syringae]UQB21757.1 FAD-binding oxidoreductase [Pseudomonas syringae pv. syringae]WHN05937.1 FAD-dependent oxidoreductase [Pseudomonas syringae pv. syringae]
MSQEYDVIVAGAGMAGAAIGYGLAGMNRRVLMLDGADTDFRAAKANFGLVWVQGKGLGHPGYQRLSIQAAQAWPEFAEQLQAESSMTVAYERNGGLNFCLSDDEWSARASELEAWHAQTPEYARSTRMLDRKELQRRFPTMRLGEAVVGASFGELDGQVNPLRLLAALQTAYLRRGGQLRNNHAVTAINALPGGGFEVVAGGFRARAERVVIAAGLGSSVLGPMVGLDVPLRPQRGQLLVTERLAPLLPVPCSGLRQTGEGTVMIGVTNEEVGYDLSTTSHGAVRMVRKAMRILPDIAKAKLVRQWSCLRVMTPDGNPVYANSVQHPGASIALCHSGLTLASFHAGEYAKALAAGVLPADLGIFHYGRFNVQKIA